MTQPFALYDELRRQAESNLNKSVNMSVICSTISSLPSQLPPEEAERHLSIILALIIHHELVEAKGMSFHTVPYGGQPLAGKDKGLLFKLDRVPPVLQHIL